MDAHEQPLYYTIDVEAMQSVDVYYVKEREGKKSRNEIDSWHCCVAP